MKSVDQYTKMSIDNVLIATDFSDTANKAFSYAAAIAGRYDSKLVVAHVINSEAFDLLESESGRSAAREACEEATRKMNQLLATLQLRQKSPQVVVAEGAASDLLLDIVRRNSIDLAVLGTHGRRAFKKLLLGSVAEEVFRLAPCPVLTVGPEAAPYSEARNIRHVLYLVEFVPDVSKAAGYAVSLADNYGAKLTVMNVREDMPAPVGAEWFEPEINHWIEQHVPHASGVRNQIQFHIGFGAAAESILEFATQADVDVIVMPVRQVDPFMAAHLAKSDTAYELVSRATCPVLTIR